MNLKMQDKILIDQAISNLSNFEEIISIQT